jgi:hypothetical protein
VPPLSTVVSQGVIYPQEKVDATNAVYQAFAAAWLHSNLTNAGGLTPTPSVAAAHAWDAVGVIAKALTSLESPAFAYQPVVLQRSIRQVKLQGATGPISFGAGSNNRQEQNAAFSFVSVQLPLQGAPVPASGIVTEVMGTVDANSIYVPTANPRAFAGLAALPVASCPPGSGAARCVCAQMAGDNSHRNNREYFNHHVLSSC